VWRWLASIAALVFACSRLEAVNLQALNLNPLLMPDVGSYGLLILSPTLLELTLINTKDPDPAQVTQWSFVDANYQLTAPNPGEFVVQAGGTTIPVQAVGFKRRPIYAPLSYRDLRIGNHLYLQLATPIADGQTVQVSNPDGSLWQSPNQFTASADPLRWSPVVHANQVGYAPAFPKKAMVGYYLGSLGEMPIPTQAVFQIINSSGAVAYQGQLTHHLDQGYTYTPTPYQEVWQADFSELATPGVYRLFVPGLGTSYPFYIDEGVPAAFARAYALGLYHQRCGTSNDTPFTRFVHGICHAGPVSVPDMTYTAVNSELASMTADYASYQTTSPQLKDVNSSLFPFVNLGPLDMSGGHHDAGDYSKYTINSAALVHYLVFAADAFPGVAALDNLGIPESGDGKSDLLQEAKWEADFLAKMQDSDGGFYFLVYPRDRQYESNVLPDQGDPQVVFPKTTAVTAAAVAALAEAGSSPLFKTLFPDRAAVYLQKAQAGWAFLNKAIATYGKDGAYQKITHYGNEFIHNDELAWAAAALFAATGDQSYHHQLQAWYSPSDPNTLRWTWWRLFEGYGCACRTYAFAARTGRLPASALDPTYLSQCENQIELAAEDHLRLAAETAYGTSFPDPNKAYRSAGWYFSSERAFDLTVAHQINPRADFLDAIFSNLNYEGGCNPVNVTYVTGLGSKRQREIVHQYAQNDRRVLPPSGLPLGNIQAGFQYLDIYQSELEEMSFPADNATTAPYPYYDRWGDSFNTTTEFVVVDQARSLGSLAFWMAQTSLKNQTWSSAAAQITGLPLSTPADQPVTAILSVPGMDLTQARVVWEARYQEPFLGANFTFAPNEVGDIWVEAEAQWPDGRRVVAVTNLTATTALNTPPNSDESAPLAVNSNMVALYHLDQALLDATGQNGSLALSGNARFDSSNLGWMGVRSGANLRFDDLGDTATAQLASLTSKSGTGPTAFVLDAMVYVDQFKAYNRANASIVTLNQNWNAYLSLGEDIYAGPFVRGGTQMEIIGSALTSVLTTKQWHHLTITISQTGYSVKIDGTIVKQVASTELSNWVENPGASLTLGNFAGWIDEVAIWNMHDATTVIDSPPTVALTNPSQGTVYVAPATINLTAAASDPDGTVAKVEFFQGSTKLGETTSSPFGFAWSSVPAGTYSLTAKATDNADSTALSTPVTVTVNPPTVATPTITPGSGTYNRWVIVSLATTTSNATIRYTTDGTDPTAASTLYTGSFTLFANTTVKAKAFASGMTDSAIATANFTVVRVKNPRKSVP
jgi:hypothetical protein